MKNVLKDCNLCPHNCHVNRYKNLGYCRANNKIKVALARPFFYEEPPISGTNGSGTIFFSNCNLKCVFCQNYDISTCGEGLEISITRLSEIMLELQKKNVHNINLVTPTMYIPEIKKAIIKAKKNGLTIPIIYNSSAYENVDALKELDGLIDVYLPDLKYFDDIYARRYSNSKDYFKYATKAILEMYRQVGPCKFEDDLIKKGVIVRHLMLPGLKNDTKEILKYLYDTYKDNIYISIMNQYTTTKYVNYDELKHPLNKNDYEEIIDYALDLGINNAFCQMDGTEKDSFIPVWNFEGVKKEIS